MTEVPRIVRLLQQAFEGKPYYGLGRLSPKNQKPLGSAA